ncbi:MAG: glycosyltransferase [bacterium]
MLKVLHAYKVYLPYNGGIPAVISRITSGLQAQVDSTILVAQPKFALGVDEYYKKIFVTRSFSLGNLFSMPLAPFYIFNFWHKAKKSSVVHCHYPFPLNDLAVFLWFPKKTGLVIHWHAEITAQKRLVRFIKPLIQRCLKRADRIIVSNPCMIDASPYLKQYREKCDVIPYGVQINHFAMSTDNMQEKVQELQQRYPRLILAVGRLVSYKGFDVLLKALSQVDAQLCIVGEGVLHDELKSLTVTLNLEERVIFAGRVNDKVLLSFYQACRIFAFPSVTEAEAFGLVQVEAMLCKKPIVNTHLNSAVSWVARDQQEALTVMPNDVQALAQALQQLLDNPALASRLGEAGYQRALSEFSESVFLARMNTLYQRVAEKYQE